jgi:hypothetical protein
MADLDQEDFSLFLIPNALGFYVYLSDLSFILLD